MFTRLQAVQLQTSDRIDKARIMTCMYTIVVNMVSPHTLVLVCLVLVGISEVGDDQKEDCYIIVGYFL